jgi:hypothetical protein
MFTPDLSQYDLEAYDLATDVALASALEAPDDTAGNWPAALASAAYGYTRGNQFSPFNAAIFGFFGYQYPLLSTFLFAVDAVFVQETPAKRFAKELYAQRDALRSRFAR